MPITPEKPLDRRLLEPGVGSCWVPFFKRLGDSSFVSLHINPRGAEPYAVIENGPRDLDTVRTSSNEETRRILEGWGIAERMTDELRQKGLPVTVYLGPGISALNSNVVLCADPAKSEDISQGLTHLVDITKEFGNIIQRTGTR